MDKDFQNCPQIRKFVDIDFTNLGVKSANLRTPSLKSFPGPSCANIQTVSCPAQLDPTQVTSPRFGPMVSQSHLFADQARSSHHSDYSLWRNNCRFRRHPAYLANGVLSRLSVRRVVLLESDCLHCLVRPPDEDPPNPTLSKRKYILRS